MRKKSALKLPKNCFKSDSKTSNIYPQAARASFTNVTLNFRLAVFSRFLVLFSTLESVFTQFWRTVLYSFYRRWLGTYYSAFRHWRNSHPQSPKHPTTCNSVAGCAPPSLRHSSPVVVYKKKYDNDDDQQQPY